MICVEQRNENVKTRLKFKCLNGHVGANRQIVTNHITHGKVVIHIQHLPREEMTGTRIIDFSPPAHPNMRVSVGGMEHLPYISKNQNMTKNVINLGKMKIKC